MIRSPTKVPPKTYEQQMKYRLTGAAIIVGFAIILISVLLKEPDIAIKGKFGNYGDNQQTFKLEIPILNSGHDAQSPAKSSSSGHDDSDDKPALLDSAVDVSAISKTATDGNIVLTKDKKANSDSDVGRNKAKPATNQNIAKAGVWTVRVGTYSRVENVDAVSALLHRHGFDPQHTKVPTELGSATRIWLGPYAKKQTAEKVSLRLKQIIGEKGYVTKQS